MKNDQQFWTAFKEVAQTAPPQHPRQDQWEHLERQLPPQKRVFPLTGWLGINLLGLLLIWSLGNLSVTHKSESLAYSNQTASQLSEDSKAFPQDTDISIPDQLPTTDHKLLASNSLSSHEFLNAQSSSTAAESSDPQLANRDLRHPEALHQPTETSSPYQQLPTTADQISVSNSSNSLPSEQTQSIDRPATDYSRQSILSAAVQLPTRLYPLANSPTIQLTGNSTVALPQVSPRRPIQLSLLLHPFHNLDGNQGLQAEIQLSSSLPISGWRGALRLSQVVSSRTWTTLSTEQIEDYQSQALGILTDAAQQEQALLIGLEITRPLLNGSGRLQISPSIGTSFRLFGRSDHRLQSITEYGTGQLATLTDYSNREGFNYWGTYLGLQFQYQLKGRLGLVAQSRLWLASQQIVPGQATSLGLGLTYRFE